MPESEIVILSGLAAIIVIVIGSAAFVSYKEFELSRFCLSKGYPQSSLSFVYESYCIKRLDQSDVVTPVKELR